MTVQLLILVVIAALTTITDSTRMWTIAIGHEWGGHEYYDAKGYLQGFGIGLIDLVCTAGEMDCRVMWGKYSDCWQSGDPGQHPHGGPGLMGKWYDACTGWIPTIERIHTFAFTLSYLNAQNGYFYVYKGNTDPFDPYNLTGKKIAFFDGWSANEQCLARTKSIVGGVLKVDQIYYYGYPNLVLEALRTGKIHAAFAVKNYWTTEQLGMIEKVAGRPVSCYLAGNSMMARKNSDFIAAWNIAFRTTLSTNKFIPFCEAENKKHAHKGFIDCINQRW